MAKVVHVMKDGSIRESIKGMTVPVNETTKAVYKIVAESCRRKRDVAV